MPSAAQEVKPPPAPLPAADLDIKLPSVPLTLPSSAGKEHAPPAATHGQQRAAALPTGPQVHLDVPRGQVSFDVRGDTLWARGDNYKVAFAPGRTTFVPFFGSQAERNHPIVFALQQTDTTGRLPPAIAQRLGAAVRYERGAVTEVYHLAADRVEQTFVVASCSGDLVLELETTTDLRVEQGAEGLRFVSALGHVSYGNAVLVDARGDRYAMQTAYANGHITLRAGRDVLDSVVFPVVVDPTIMTFSVSTSASYDLSQPDIAFGVGNQRYMVAWEFRNSAADYDVLTAAVDPSGIVIPGSQAWIDTSTDSWQAPRIAYNRLGDTFLVVASVVPAAGGNASINSRTRASASTAVGTVQQLSGAESGPKVNPDVGGDSYTFGPTYFAVVWQRSLSTTDADIHYRIVASDGTPLASVQTIDNSPATLDLRPRIAKCDGAGPSAYQVWPVVWHRDVGVHDDIYGARLRWDGLLQTPSFVIDSTTDTDRYASVSSLASAGATRKWLVAYQTDTLGDLDVYMRLFLDGNTPVEIGHGFLADSEALPPPDRQRHQLLPQVDSDGCRFAIGYVEEYSLTDWDVFVTTVHHGSGTTMSATDARVPLDTSTLFSTSVSIAAQSSGGGPVGHYAAVWDADSTSGPFRSEIRGATYDGLGPGGYSTRSTACAGLTLTHSVVQPALGATMTFSVGGTTAARFILLSVPATAATLCPEGCKIGIDPNLMVPFSTAVLQVAIPCDYVLLGGHLAFQGGAVGVAGGCAAFGNLAFTDTIDVTIR